MTGLNPAMLRWARERAGMDIADVAAAIKKSEAVVAAWEAGESSPTYPQLEKLAYQVFKRPLALFFFPDPPEEVDPARSFRTLPEFEIRRLTPQTRFRIRQAQAFQEALYEMTGGRNPAPRLIFHELWVQPGQDVQGLANRVREFLAIPLRRQVQGWGSSAAALKGWRTAIERAGVFVFKQSFRQKEVSGFCLYDEEFPIIFLNNSVAHNRQIFTLFHELAHILARTGGITKADDDFIRALQGEARDIEVFCNRFAASLLVPEDGFLSRVGDRPLSDDEIGAVAREYKVSREVIATRLLELGRLSREDYIQRVAGWRQEGESKRGKGGGDYYANTTTYLGEAYLNLGFSTYYQGRLSAGQLAEFLGVKQSNLPDLEHYYLEHASA